MKKILLLCCFVIFSSCGSNSEDWACIEDDDIMYSRDSNGNLGGAGKGCSCEEIEDFEFRTFGEVDYDALKSDFGCEF